MGCTPSKHVVEGSFNAPISLPMPVHDLAEKQEEYSNYKLRKDQDGQAEKSSSGMAANLSTWSKVNNLLVKCKPSFKSNQGNSKKNSNSGDLQEEETIIVSNRKSVDQAFYFHVLNMKDVEQLVKGQIEPRAGIWQRVTHGVKVADERLYLLQRTPLKTEKSKWRRKVPRGGEDRVVLYFTSLRGIRRTFDNCHTVKMILSCFNVLVDERDISMHNQFRQELQDLLGKSITVPRLFIAGKYIGGIEEILQLHETGELKKYLESFPRHTSSTRHCHGCNDSRFVPCLNCDGSRKIFTQKLGCEDNGRIVWMTCPQCNENGLIRCPLCCGDAAFMKS